MHAARSIATNICKRSETSLDNPDGQRVCPIAAIQQRLFDRPWASAVMKDSRANVCFSGSLVSTVLAVNFSLPLSLPAATAARTAISIALVQKTRQVTCRDSGISQQNYAMSC